jgi:hypothetical protein
MGLLVLDEYRRDELLYRIVWRRRPGVHEQEREGRLAV